ncbi:MAG TPA: YceI family protein [Candidatus Acidoferrales bacterium]|nr:YceI family protein [Candidatus Acidoferrales bacterium]
MKINKTSRRRFRAPLILASIAWLAVLFLVQPARAQESVVQIEPAQTKIDFSLGSTLHTVHGTFALKSGSIQFDPSGGKISGAIVVDANSGESGNSGRDSRMHREILESAKFPEIVFTPTQMTGTVAAQGPSKVEVSGQFRLHGKDHEVTLPVDVVSEGPKLQMTFHFVIPYIEWGLKNPSTFILRASDKVEIDIHATGHVETAMASH